ncbi:MAG: hypothetical protein LBE82_11765 [Chitinophagaceae bacterium]|jgi:hypothetical protein|nr:hypothetical protein [Chitinophagaceae bacterium]
MSEVRDPYYRRAEVSNSDLSWLKKQFQPENVIINLEKTYANGTLIDAMITEPHRVDYFKKRVQYEGYQFSDEEFDAAKEMKKSFYRDAFCAQFAGQCSFQKISVVPDFQIEFDGFRFMLPARCKWDLFVDKFDLSGDIKSTACTTQKQCEEAVRYFDYDRSRAWYMDLENRSNDILIFISKVNFKIFKIPVKRDSELYREGKAKYQDLAFKWWTLFPNN